MGQLTPFCVEFWCYRDQINLPKHADKEITDRLFGKLAGDDVKRVISELGSTREKYGNEELFTLFKHFLDYLKITENNNKITD